MDTHDAIGVDEANLKSQDPAVRLRVESTSDWIETMLHHNGERWLLGHTAYKLTKGTIAESDQDGYYPKWNKGFFITDVNQHGFLFIVPDRYRDNLYWLYFALVSRNFRRSGVLKQMMKDLEKVLPLGCTVCLDVAAENLLHLWLSFGFKRSEMNCSEMNCSNILEKQLV